MEAVQSEGKRRERNASLICAALGWRGKVCFCFSLKPHPIRAERAVCSLSPALLSLLECMLCAVGLTPAVVSVTQLGSKEKAPGNAPSEAERLSRPLLLWRALWQCSWPKTCQSRWPFYQVPLGLWERRSLESCMPGQAGLGSTHPSCV